MGVLRGLGKNHRYRTASRGSIERAIQQATRARADPTATMVISTNTTVPANTSETFFGPVSILTSVTLTIESDATVEIIDIK